ncbi:hypothetical protein GCM10023093_09820 [Nemorincola caseinilytica]|uniref:Polyketide cyclase / dehydrase and lipid transport n=1 Tax=Nemorincola caseinilytica TaxID=2054315 RepID=A0ABP8NBV2_9BACT
MSSLLPQKRTGKVGRILLIIACIPLLFFMVLLIMGAFAHVPYYGSETRIVHAPAAKVWALLADTRMFDANRHEVRSVEMLEDGTNGPRRWREHTLLVGDMYYTALQQRPEDLMVIRMDKSDFGMHGTWQFTLVPVGGYTRVTITETSQTEGLIMRSILNALGRNANMILLLRALEDGVKKM